MTNRQPAAEDRPVLRPLRESDVESVVSVYGTAWGDARPIDAQDIRSWLRNPEVEPGSLRVLEIDGAIVGYGDVSIGGGEVALEVAALDHWSTFLAWAEETARCAQASRVRVLSYAGDALARAAARRGYELWRSSYTLQVELDRVGHSNPPSGIELRPYRQSDAEQLRTGLNEVFARDPFFTTVSPARFREEYVHARGMDPSLWLLAWQDGELAGFVLAFLERAGDIKVGRVESLGVRPAWRRRGLGEALLHAVFRELQGRGRQAAVLGVDASNETGAVRLYERVGMSVVAQGDNWALDL